MKLWGRIATLRGHWQAVSMVLTVTTMLCTNVHATGCTQKEYAQYKDQARNEIGKRSLAIDYCTLRRSVEAERRYARDVGSVRGPDYLGVCDSEAGKMIDALQAADDPYVVAWALQGCLGDIQKPTIPTTKK